LLPHSTGRFTAAARRVPVSRIHSNAFRPADGILRAAAEVDLGDGTEPEVDAVGHMRAGCKMGGNMAGRLPRDRRSENA
jgi:hypothetical protein